MWVLFTSFAVTFSEVRRGSMIAITHSGGVRAKGLEIDTWLSIS